MPEIAKTRQYYFFVFPKKEIGKILSYSQIVT